MITNLPGSSELDIPAFSRLFAKTTNSYKFIFFLSFLDILKERRFVAEPISFREMVVEMLANSWYPHTYFKLSFGLQDKIAAQLNSLSLEMSKPILRFNDTDKRLLREAIGRQNLDESLMRFVPFRLLRPFFENDLRGAKDYQVDRQIASLTEHLFEERKPLYRLDQEKRCIVPHKAWVEYLKTHYSIIQGWASWQWLEYMQRHNQNVPAISAKLFPPQARDSLKAQTEYWRAILNHTSLDCIYSGKPIDAKSISLDHYLPWSFIAHDQLWNLIPTLPEINSAKSDNLPAKVYFDRFVRLQHQGLTISRSLFTEQSWEKRIESFFSALKFSDERDLLDLEKLKTAYQQTLLPLQELARNLGFASNWHFRSKS